MKRAFRLKWGWLACRQKIARYYLPDRLLLAGSVRQRNAEERRGVLPAEVHAAISATDAAEIDTCTERKDPGQRQDQPGQRASCRQLARDGDKVSTRTLRLAVPVMERLIQLNQDFFAGAAVTGGPGRPPGAGNETVMCWTCGG